MANKILIILLVIIVLSLIISIVCSYMSSQKAQEHDDTAASNYSIASIAFICISIVALGILILIQYKSAKPSPQDNIDKLVNETTAALNKHVGIINDHVGIINGALDKVSGVSSGLAKGCSTADKFSCNPNKGRDDWGGKGHWIM
jgi:phosphatidylglycerophosphate synthase